MIAVVELEKYLPIISIFNIFICKFSYQQKLCLVILFKVNNNLQLYFYYIILILDLLIGLQLKMIKNKYLILKKIVKRKLEFQDKNQTYIIDNRVWNIIKPNNNIKNTLYQARYIDYNFYQLMKYYFYQLINNYQY